MKTPLDLGEKSIFDVFLSLPEKEIAFWKEEDVWHLHFGKYARCTSPEKISEGVGFFSYDFGKEQLGVRGNTDNVPPPFEWRKYSWKIQSDRYGKNIRLECSKQEERKAKKYILDGISQEKKRDFCLEKFEPIHTKEIWEKSFQKTKEYIFAGEVYQLNLARQFSAAFKGDSRELFLYFLQKNPAPHAAFFGGSNYEILSFSPELFLRFAGDKITTEPIKGTRPRKLDEVEDEVERKSLLESKKESAELLMITDLLRNDLKQTCMAGSIKLESLREIQKNPTVWHTLSRISGIRKAGFSPIDTLLSCLPGGSISGCPKKRAVEIIEELEPHQRGPFCGIFGYFDEEKNGRFSILIRTLLHKNGRVFFQAGGGITADSERDSEFEEGMQKGKVFFEE